MLPLVNLVRHEISPKHTRCHRLIRPCLFPWRQRMLESAPMRASDRHRFVVLILLVASIALLLPGLILPVLTIRGVLTREGIARMAPRILENGLDDATVNTLSSMMNPAVVAMAQALGGGDLRKVIIDRLSPQITAALQARMTEVEIYQQTRSIVG